LRTGAAGTAADAAFIPNHPAWTKFSVNCEKNFGFRRLFDHTLFEEKLFIRAIRLPQCYVFIRARVHEKAKKAGVTVFSAFWIHLAH